MDFLSFLLYLLLVWIPIHLLSNYANKGKGRKLPPGPYPLPVVGNLLSIGTKPHVSLANLAKTYGPLMTLQLGQVPTVVISSATIAKEALQKNDISFCNRMVIDAPCVLNHEKYSLVFSPANAHWRTLRKICNSHVFSTTRLDATQSLRKNKVKDLLDYVRKCSDAGVSVDIGQAAFTATLNLLSTTFFSVDLGDPDSQIAHEFRHTVQGIFIEMGRFNLVDFFPFLKNTDLQRIKRRTTAHGGMMLDLFMTMINERLQSKGQGVVASNMDVLDSLFGINQDQIVEIEPLNIAHLLVDIFTAGTDTTSSTVEWAMAELLHNPEKLKKAQAELEEIIGKGNPLEESDVARLPYLQAVMKETFRLHPVAPLLVPRKVDSDVDLSGYTVPKDAQVLINVWAIGRDPGIWENPKSFEPERFLGSKLDVKGQDFELIPFGAGRRICPGMPLAIRMVHLMLASLIHGFDWKLEDGISPENMDMEDMFRFNLQKAQSLCTIATPR